ncbi:troponin I, fast skeletal muscle [Glossophaga mutica]
MEGDGSPTWAKSEGRGPRPRKTLSPPCRQQRHGGSGPGRRGSGASARSPWKWLPSDYCVPTRPAGTPVPPHTLRARPLPRTHTGPQAARGPRCPERAPGRALHVWGARGAAPAGGPDSAPLPTLQKRNRAITARRQHLKSVMLQIAATELEKEESRKETEKQNYLAEHCAPLHIPSSTAEVQELCKQLHAKIDVAEEEKYDMEMKVQKSTKELEDMNQKLFDLRGKFKRPPLRRVRMSADAMLKALLGSKHKVCMDLRANLKQVKKEDTEKERDLRDVGDWRKNIEEKSGMEGRKKMFESES